MIPRQTLFRAMGTVCFVFAALLVAGILGLVGETNELAAEVGFVPVLIIVLVFGGAGLLRKAGRPYLGAGRARQWVSIALLLCAAVLGASFLLLVLAGEGELIVSGIAPVLFLAVVSGASGLALRGINRSGSFRTNLFLLGAAAVSVPLFLLLFLSGSESETIDQTPDGTETTIEIVRTSDSTLVLATALLLLVGVAAISFWSKQAVAPMAEITAVANDIQVGSLDRRIGLQNGTREVRELAESFNQMLDRLDAASDEQRQLLEDVSHELRTPLAALALNNELLLDTEEPSVDDYREAAERNRALTDRLQTTVDQLLQRRRAANLEVQQTNNDLMAIVHSVADQHRLLSPEVPIAVRGPGTLRLGIDGPSISRALANLVENAVRYSPPGVPVEIEVMTTNDSTVLSVTDHGPGIPAAQQARLFERYYQADGEVNGSAGIGLALVKQVAEAHGSIEVTSPLTDDGGTRFSLIFNR